MKRMLLAVLLLTACGKKSKAPEAHRCDPIKPTARLVVMHDAEAKSAKVAEWAKAHLEDGVSVFFEACKAKNWDDATIACVVAADPKTFGDCMNAMSFEQTTDLSMRIRHLTRRMKDDLGE
jgi:hypothetical protein